MIVFCLRPLNQMKLNIILAAKPITYLQVMSLPANMIACSNHR